MRSPMSVFTKVLRAGEGKKVRNLEAVVPSINALEAEVTALSDEELADMTVAFRERLDQGENLNDLLVEAVRRGPGGGTAHVSASATSTSSSWAAWRCTSAGSPR